MERGRGGGRTRRWGRGKVRRERQWGNHRQRRRDKKKQIRRGVEPASDGDAEEKGVKEKESMSDCFTGSF